MISEPKDTRLNGKTVNSSVYISYIKDNKLGWAMYKLPGKSEIILLAGPSQNAEDGNINGEAYLIAPFNTVNYSPIYIEADLRLSWDNHETVDDHINLPQYYRSAKREHLDNIEHNYKSSVLSYLKQIETSDLVKAVAARSQPIQLRENFNLISWFKGLCSQYPNAYCCISSTTDFGTWAGASPELLLKYHISGSIESVSLAGTISVEQNQLVSIEPSELFTDKELREQNIVTKYIGDVLGKYLQDVNVQGPMLMHAGNLIHVATRFSGRIQKRISNELHTLLKELHPTPAVCGFPKRQAFNLIRMTEKFERGLYTGYWGPMNVNFESALFVNLRCLEIAAPECAYLFSGAGIVAGSDADAEWEETNNKMKTLLSVAGLT